MDILDTTSNRRPHKRQNHTRARLPQRGRIPRLLYRSSIQRSVRLEEFNCLPVRPSLRRLDRPSLLACSLQQLYVLLRSDLFGIRTYAAPGSCFEAATDMCWSTCLLRLLLAAFSPSFYAPMDSTYVFSQFPTLTLRVRHLVLSRAVQFVLSSLQS